MHSVPKRWRCRAETSRPCGAPVSPAADPAAARQQALDATGAGVVPVVPRAFECDLNAFYPGLAALQMGHILQLLAQLPAWRNLFKGDKLQADRARQDLETELPALTHVVAAPSSGPANRLPED